MSKIKKALEYIQQGMNPHAAAIKAQAAPTHVYKALQVARDRAEGKCPCCHQKLPDKQHLTTP